MPASFLLRITQRTATAIRRSALFYGPLILGCVCFSLYSVVWLGAAAGLEKTINDRIIHLKDLGIDFKSEEISVSGYPFFLRLRVDKPELAQPRKWKWSVYRVHLEASPLNLKSVRVALKGPQNFHLWQDDITSHSHGVSPPQLSPIETSPPMKIPPMIALSGSAQQFIISLEENDVRVDLRDMVIGPAMAEPSQAGVTIARILANIRPAAAIESSKTEGRAAFSVVLSGMRPQIENGAERGATTVEAGDQPLNALLPAMAIAQFDMAGIFEHPTQRLRDSKIAFRHLKLDLAYGRHATAPADRSAIAAAQRQGATRILSSGHLHIDESGFPAGRLDLSLEDARIVERILMDIAIINPAEKAGRFSLSSLSIADNTTTIPIMATDGYVQVAGRNLIELPRLFASPAE